MSYEEIALTVRVFFPFLTVIIFSIIVLFGDDKGRIHSFIICVMCVIYFFMPEMPEGLTVEEYRKAFSKSAYIAVLINGATGLAMTMFLRLDDKALKHAIILCFAVTVNVMVIFYIESKTYGFFALYFNELLILISILQIGISRNGLSTALCNISELLRGTYVYSNDISKNLLAREKRETKT